MTVVALTHLKGVSFHFRLLVTFLRLTFSPQVVVSMKRHQRAYLYVADNSIVLSLLLTQKHVTLISIFQFHFDTKVDQLKHNSK